MAFTLVAILIAVGLFGGMLVMQVVGRRLGEHERRLDPDGKHDGATAAEAAVVGLLGLLVAFTFSGAGSRFDSRRNLIVDETNAIGTAYLRIDLLPADRQPQLRDLFRKYVDARIAAYRAVPDMARPLRRAIVPSTPTSPSNRWRHRRAPRSRASLRRWSATSRTSRER